MTKNGNFFTLLFSRSTKSRIYIKRVDVSRSFVQNGLLGITLLVGVSVFGIGLSGVFGGSLSQGFEVAAKVANPAASQLSSSTPSKQNAINYSRPEIAGDFVFNAGGPADLNAAGDGGDIAARLQNIVKTSSPTNVPSVWAHMGKINNEFGFRRNPFGGRTYEFHPGLDIDGERGDPVIATANGVVSKAGWQGGYGNMIEMDHGNGLITRYGHLSKIDVAVGDAITRGQAMGQVGSTGRSTGPHLHYEMRMNDKPINPRQFLPPEPTDIRRAVN
ncbi:MAG: M23 family metallopeptidase [Acidobacteria bacterium]|nr:M23 family metallopeptidase [Acidobacteriota bacterium]MCA1609025.1 M23 family metallopeptidase [Acidobacteriota bacterium]